MITITSFALSNILPIGTITIAIILGIIIGNTINIDNKYHDGINYTEKTILSFAIALMGVNLDFSILTSLGIKTILLIISGMILTIYSAILLGKYFKINTHLALLLGIGNGVCGASAISATAPIIKANKDFIGLCIAIVNLLGTIGIFILPFIALSFGLNEIDSGILIGNTLQAVGQVTAAGFGISETSGISATTVKMGRILLLTPLIMILIYIFSKNNSTQNKTKIIIPIFIILFIVFSLISSLNLINHNLINIISSISHFALVLAMSAIGLKIHFNSIKANGKIALKIASFVFIIQILFTLLLLLL
ncbi:Putative membrane protein YeiH [hydrothermal vent metagenome]|uniref:Membrane protein YeiH n=1 Tax=hydrothermal vent metagenome TaxID=652676 RepID=A0A3B1E181_9ZZZZ